jgi:hypothetical protein
MRRRDFIKTAVGVAVWPVVARAQQADKVWRMGFIAHGHETFYDALFEGLREYGYQEGRNLMVERRYARGQAERFKEFAAEMVKRPNTWLHRPMLQTFKKVLANSEPSTHGRKADMARAVRNVRL